MDTTQPIERILKKIREARKTKGLSHENMAFELNMSSSAYNKLERSETTLTLERLLKIKDILDLSFSDLFEIKKGDILHQDLKDNAIGKVESIYQDNKEVNEKFIASLQEEIQFLRKIVSENKKG